MSDIPHVQAPKLQGRAWLPLLEGIVFTVLVMVALPISQLIQEIRKPEPYQLVEPGAIKPPEMKIPPPPILDPKKEEKKPEITHKRDLPPLNPFDVPLNPVMSGFSGGWTVTVPEMEGYEEIIEMDLTRAPRPISQPKPLYPPDLKKVGQEGEVYLRFVVHANGTTSHYEVLASSHPEFSEAAIRSVRKWTFEPAEKDGRIVTTRVQLKIPFKIH